MKRLFLFALAVASLSACKKDSENTPSKTELLTAKNWRVTAITSTRTVTVTGSNPSTTTTDIYPQVAACQRDNFYKFNTDKTMVEDEGTSICNTNPPTPQKTNYDWDFNGDQTKLLVKAKTVTAYETSDIAELSATTLRLRDTDTYTVGTTTTTTVDETTFTAF